MEYLLSAKGLWSVVEIGFSGQEEGTKLTEAQKGHLDDARLKDHQVKRYLFQAIYRTVCEQILDRRTAKDCLGLNETKILWKPKSEEISP